ELAHAFPGGIGIGDVVVAQRLALQLLEGGQRAGRRIQVTIERRLLVRVLPVTQVHELDEAAVGLGRERRALWQGGCGVGDRRQVVADRRVVLRDAIEGGDGERKARTRRQAAGVRLQFAEQRRVLRRRRGDGDAGEVLRRR